MPDTLYKDDIAVVGIGCVFPDSPNPDTFWKRVLAGEPSIRRAPADRWPEDLYLDETGEDPDKTYSTFGAYVAETEVRRLALAHGLDFKDTNRFQVFLLEATHQALATVPEAKRAGWKAGWFLGALGPDDQVSEHKLILERPRLLEHIETLPAAERAPARAILDSTLRRLEAERSTPLPLVVNTAAVDRLQRHFKMPGERCLVGAACASSLAAADVAMKKLRARECDIALTGGVETQLAPEYFVLFSRLGLMSHGRCLPLDDKTDGVNQGEGAAVFALVRLDDAMKAGLPVKAILRGCGGSSNGRGASLFSPTSDGQRLALERAYGDNKPARLDFLECHATGTRLGDATEIDTLDAFFKGAPTPIPIGSVKSLIGHTKGAAGAAGMLKCILALTHRTAPPSPYFESYIEERAPTAVFVNPKPVLMAKEGTLRAGVSSAGFGGTNYHLFLETFSQTTALAERPKLEVGPVSVLAQSFVPRENFLDFFPSYGFKIPPNNLNQIDVSQLLTLMAVSEALDRSGLDWDQIPRDRVAVISSCSLGLDAWLNCRVRHWEFARGRKGDEPGLKGLISHRERYPKIGEDAGPGTLDNVIAGRVANQFDFHGPNYHVDADLNSFACALSAARLELWQKTSDYVVAIGVEDIIDEALPDVRKAGVHCLLLARPGEVPDVGKGPLFTLEGIDFQP